MIETAELGFRGRLHGPLTALRKRWWVVASSASLAAAIALGVADADRLGGSLLFDMCLGVAAGIVVGIAAVLIGDRLIWPEARRNISLVERERQLAKEIQELGHRKRAIEQMRQELAGVESNADAVRGELAKREQTIRRQESDLQARARSLEEMERRRSRRADDVERLAAALNQRERELDRRAQRVDAVPEEPLAAVDDRLDSRSQELDEAEERNRRKAEELDLRAAALAERDAELTRLQQLLATRERELEARLAELTQSETADTPARPAEQPRLEAVPEPPTPARPVASPAEAPAAPARSIAPRTLAPLPRRGAPPRRGAWKLSDLERLVAEHAADQSPERISELRYYLLYLREFAGSDGALDAMFDPLVNDVFAEFIRSARAG